MPKDTPSPRGSNAALRQAAAEERRLIERERRAERLLAAAKAKLAAAEQKLAQAQARVARRTEAVGEGEARLRRRQQERAVGPSEEQEAWAAPRPAPSNVIDAPDEAALRSGPASSDDVRNDGVALPVADGGLAVLSLEEISGAKKVSNRRF